MAQPITARHSRTTRASAAPVSGAVLVLALGVLLSALGGGCDNGGACATGGSATRAGAWASCTRAEPPSSLNDENCCGALGFCLQGSILPASQVGELARDTCGAAGAVCVPKELAIPGFVPPSCRSLGNAEGRCLSECLPVVQSQNATLPQSTCGSSSKCVPCYDPLTGGLTGACNLSSNDAPNEPATTFASCCG